MATENSASKLATPRRTTPMQALSGLFRTPTRLRTPTTVSRRNKRARARTSSLSSSTPTMPSTPSLPAVVLQTYSVSTDSIVLTALPSVPFCCHEDLLTMSRAQLEAVVRALNARLPRRMRIGPEDDFWNDDLARNGEYDDDDDDDRLSRMSEAEMKRRVEELVGIRPVVGKNRVSRLGLGLGTRSGVPPAPKAMRTRDAAWRPYDKTPWEMDVDAAGDLSDDSSIMIEDAVMGSSPLASRTTKFGFHMRHTLPRLAILQEENEGGESKEDDSEDNEPRPSKRQRMALGSAIEDSKGGFQIVQEARQSRIVENMDLSGSPLMARDDASSENLADRNEGATMATINSDCAATVPDEDVPDPPQRRRSARIKEIALRRKSSIGTGKKLSSSARDLKSALLHSTSKRLSKSASTSLERSNSGKPEDSAAPRELTIRLPFTSTPPHEKTGDSSWSAPRVLRSHSQRLQSSNQPAFSLGRTQSEKYLRPSDLTFVTINRPRYRFTRRESKGAKVSKEDQELHPSILREHDACQSQQGIMIGSERATGQYERERVEEKDNDYPKVATKSFLVGSHRAAPSSLCSILAPRSRAPSTSTTASTQGDSSDSPARMVTKDGMASTTTATVLELVARDGATDHMWEALGRMVVDAP